jgi:hypothetical protein
MLKGGPPKKKDKLGGEKPTTFFSDREGGCLRGLVQYLTISLGHCSRVELVTGNLHGGRVEGGGIDEEGKLVQTQAWSSRGKMTSTANTCMSLNSIRNLKNNRQCPDDYILKQRI